MEAVSDFFSEEKFYFWNIAAIFVTLFVGRLILRELLVFLNGFQAFFLAPMGLGTLNLKKYGSWAVVTGASEGIGKGYALELAKRGLNVVLMSRSEEKLNKVATEIREKYNRETRVIPVDFSGGCEIYAPLADQLNDLDVGVLINNVGQSYVPDVICNLSPERLYKVVQINCQPVVQMSRILLPKMVSRGGGVIVNISSSLSLVPVIHMFVYSATKMYVNYVSDGLRKEYGSKGIIVQNVQPFLVSTGLTRNPRVTYAVPTGPTFAKAAVATIGIQDNTYGCFSHAIQGYIASKLPFLFDRMFLAREKREKAN